MKVRVCSVKNCGKEAVKSLSIEKIKEVNLNLEMEIKGRRVYLCKEHYREVKKARRKLERLERWRWK